MSSRKTFALTSAIALTVIPAALAHIRALRTAHAAVDGQAIVLRGKPFFPVMLLDQCDPHASAHARSLGVNLILNESCQGVSPRRQLARVTPSSYAVLPMRARGIQGPRLVGWTFPDEPDNNGWTPAALSRRFTFRAGTPDGLLSFMTLSGRFYRPLYGSRAISGSTVSAFAKLPDVSGFDLYPLNHCDQDLSTVSDAQRQFAALAGGRPTFQWIETGPIEPSYCGGFQMTPQQLTAETWLAVVGGARGIGFFTHTWTPTHSSFDVPSALQQTIRQTSASMRALIPGLTGRTVPSSVNSSAIQVLARTSRGATYVFAVNTLTSPVKAQINVPTLQDGPAALFGERRSVAVSYSAFTDDFQPLGVHIYVQRN